MLYFLFLAVELELDGQKNNKQAGSELWLCSITLCIRTEKSQEWVFLLSVWIGWRPVMKLTQQKRDDPLPVEFSAAARTQVGRVGFVN